jgi:cyclopropane-fatty-acyl-phospholipid synthase
LRWLPALPFSVRFWDGSTLGPRAGTPKQAVVLIRSPKALSYLVREPNQLGLARAWVTGMVDVEGDLEAVLAARERFHGIALSARDRGRLALSAFLAAGPRLLRRPPVPSIEAARDGRGRHSLARDRRSVRHHYDVSNDFYRIVLGPSMTYSCAYFRSAKDTLEAAQEQKHELICRKLRLEPGERLLDVGCGWGSLLLHAATRHDVRGVGVTLSEPQAELARARVREAGVGDRVEIRVADYREIDDGPYDKVVSVGMYEHVGRSQLGRYASTITGLLRKGGLFLNHGIACADDGPPDPDTFISRYIFPDGELHPVTEIISAMQAAELEARDVESLREHYPLTLRRWVANLERRRTEAIAHASEERARAWRLYMLGSAQAFEAGEITVYQVLAARKGAPHRLPLNRAELIGAPALAPRKEIEHAS